ncbi:MAG TPA: plastocyanin/azurin family copper-binding protein [Candidatus Dormibacteraeota bacterium]|jgi:plastocyanin|nr:plastocyanin/azurin family copper-binding protein [Candidatus Dormibacteraeota bacterium]
MRRWRTMLLGLCSSAVLVLSACGNGPPSDQGNDGGGVDTSGIQAVNPPATAAGAPIKGTDNLTFDPGTSSAKVGDVVEWDAQTVDHNVTFDNGPRADLPAGGKVQFKFTKAGSFHYTCTIHPGMEGTLNVS